MTKIISLVDEAGLIVNRAVVDDGSKWSPEARLTAVEETITMEIGATYINGVYTAPPAPPLPPPPQMVLPQDLMAQFTVTDFTAIRAAISVNDQLGLMWSQMQAQRDPMRVTNKRFLAGWNALVQILGQPRMTAIAAALGVTIG
jgi:hypothetical protein